MKRLLFNGKLAVGDNQTATMTAQLLREEAGLFLVHVVPIELVDRDAWENDGNRFSLELGKATAGFLLRELAKSIALGDLKDKDGILQIGVAGGQTVFGLFDELKQIPKLNGLKRVESVPLVLSAVLPGLYSAEAVAQLAAQRFGACVSASASPSGEPNVRPRHEVGVRPNKLDESTIDDLDWLVVGIGSNKSSSLKLHFASVDYEPAVYESAIGDICSRLFDVNGREVGSETSDAFVGIRMDQLAKMAKSTSPRIARVLAVAGGKDKVKPLAAILRAEPRVVNFLVTDELTAEALIRILRARPPASPAANPTSVPAAAQDSLQQIPMAVLHAYEGKWIIWDEEDRKVLGSGDTFEEAQEQADRTGSEHLQRIHYSSWTDGEPAEIETS